MKTYLNTMDQRPYFQASEIPGGSVIIIIIIIISGPNENSQKASIIIIMIRTGSQMENKLHENVSKKVGRPKEHTG